MLVRFKLTPITCVRHVYKFIFVHIFHIILIYINQVLPLNFRHVRIYIFTCWSHLNRNLHSCFTFTSSTLPSHVPNGQHCTALNNCTEWGGSVTGANCGQDLVSLFAHLLSYLPSYHQHFRCQLALIVKSFLSSESSWFSHFMLWSELWFERAIVFKIVTTRDVSPPQQIVIWDAMAIKTLSNVPPTPPHSLSP